MGIIYLTPLIDIECNKHEQEQFVTYWNKYADQATITELYTWSWMGQTESVSRNYDHKKSASYSNN